MRLGFFSDSYRPYTSGVVRSIESFSAQLRARGHQVYIFAPNYPHCPPEEGVFRFWSVPAPTQKDFTLALPFSPSIDKRVRDLGLDVIHVHSPFLLGRLGARVAARLDLPLVFTYHTLYDQYVHYVPFFQQVSRAVVLRYTREFCNRCDLVIAPSASVAQAIQANGVRAPLRVIPTGIPWEKFQGRDAGWLKRRLGLPPQARLLLYVGRLAREKNLEFLLRCFARLAAHQENLYLVLVGDGLARAELAARSREMGLRERVRFTGVLSAGEVACCYAAAEVFVFASLTETQGLVITEAMAGGLPVVAVDASGVRDVVVDRDNGYLTPLEEGAFTERVAELLADPLQRRAMGGRARETARLFSLEHTTSQLEEAYRELLERRPPAGALAGEKSRVG